MTSKTKTITRLFTNLTTNGNSFTLVPAPTNGVISDIRMEWKAKSTGTIVPNVIETSIWCSFRDGDSHAVIGDGTNAIDLIIIPPYTGFQWFNPFSVVIQQAADLIRQLRMPTVNANKPYGAWRNGLSVAVFMESQVPNVPHDLEMTMNVLEFDV